MKKIQQLLMPIFKVLEKAIKGVLTKLVTKLFGLNGLPGSYPDAPALPKFAEDAVKAVNSSGAVDPITKVPTSVSGAVNLASKVDDGGSKLNPLKLYHTCAFNNKWAYHS